MRNLKMSILFILLSSACGELPPEEAPGSDEQREAISALTNDLSSFSTSTLPAEEVCSQNADCEQGQFCDVDCKFGVCKDVKECDFVEGDMVCGVDGHFYANSCYAKVNEVIIAETYEGCEEVSCFTNFDCSAALFCHSEIGVCGGKAGGICKFRQSCSATDSVNKVCGCDGQTYYNSCQARQDGVSLSHDGECK